MKKKYANNQSKWYHIFLIFNYLGILMKIKIITLPIATILALSAQSALAKNPTTNKSFMGLGYLSSTYKVDEVLSNINLDKKDTSFKIFFGDNIGENFTTEIHYAKLGKATASSKSAFSYTIGGKKLNVAANTKASVDTNSTGISGSYQFLTGRVKPFIKLGAHRWSVKANSTTDSLSENGFDLFYGAGVQVKVAGQLDIRAEFEQFKIDNDKIDVFSASIVRRFF
jgi:opacity protein-like surface antigen